MSDYPKEMMLDALRWQWFREQIKDDRRRVVAQGMLWNTNSRRELDRWVDDARAADVSTRNSVK